jgi:hypothetical protein
VLPLYLRWQKGEESIMATVAIVTSISFGSDNEACFKKGLLAILGTLPTILPPFEARGDYNLLRTLVTSAARNNPKPDLIVTAGGLVTADAASKVLGQTDPKFIFLSGDMLSVAHPTALAGGVNMNCPGEDQVRRKKLTDPPFSVPTGKIYLVVNSNALMSDNDATGWPSAKVARFFKGIPNPDNTNVNNFVAEFKALAQNNPRPEGLVISADSYFRLWRTAFTAALGTTLPVPVCSPFQDFIDAINNQSTKPNIANSISLDLPKLNNPTNDDDPNTAYFQLGKQAGRFLANATDVKVVAWDAATSKWLPPS